MNNEAYVFEVFIIDFKEKAICPDAESLLHFVQACRALWTEGSPQHAGEHSATDGALTVAVADETGLGQPALSKSDSATKSFTISMSSDFEKTARSRRVLLEHIAKAGFSDKYIVRDDVSAEVAEKLYPHLYKIENSLRRYVAKFMCVKVGQGWFGSTVSKTVRDSLGDRKKEEKPFGGDLHSCEVHLLDFADLGDVVYGAGGGVLSHEALISHVNKMEFSDDAVKDLKLRIESNYTKYFSDTLKKRDFQKLWQEWLQIRVRIAHTRFFDASEVKEGILLAKKILKSLEEASDEIAAFTLDDITKSDLQEQAVSDLSVINERSVLADQGQPANTPIQASELNTVFNTSSNPTRPTKEVLLAELKSQLEIMRTRPNGFVGLKRFIDYTMGGKGFDEYQTQELIREINSSGEIEVYKVTNPFNPEFQTSALRLKSVP